jgi:hypothetical protein
VQQSEDLTLAPLRVPAFTVVGNKRSGTDFLQVGRATKWFWVVEHSLLLPDEKAVANADLGFRVDWSEALLLEFNQHIQTSIQPQHG